MNRLIVYLSKAKKMPVGTVSRGRKKVSEGKWVDVPKGNPVVADSAEVSRAGKIADAMRTYIKDLKHDIQTTKGMTNTQVQRYKPKVDDADFDAFCNNIVRWVSSQVKDGNIPKAFMTKIKNAYHDDAMGMLGGRESSVSYAEKLLSIVGDVKNALSKRGGK